MKGQDRMLTGREAPTQNVTTFLLANKGAEPGPIHCNSCMIAENVVVDKGAPAVYG